jgi:hypothetical protein
MDKNVAKISYNRLIFITLRSKKMNNKKSAFIAVAQTRRKTDIQMTYNVTNVTIAALFSLLAN